MVYSESNMPRRNNKVRYEVVERIGVLNRKKSGWTREVNVVAWNGNEPKVDIREWDPQHERMSRGVTLLEEEAEVLAKYLARRYGLIYPENNSRGYTDSHQQNQRYSDSGSQNRDYDRERYQSAERSSGSSLYDEADDIPFESSPDNGRLYDEGLVTEPDYRNQAAEEQASGGGLYEEQAYGDGIAGDGAGGSAAVAAEGGAGQDDGYEAAPADDDL